MKQNWLIPTEIKMVPTEPTPAKLFVCSAKIKLGAGAALRNAFDKGIDLPKGLAATYNKHLIYAYGDNKKNSYWEAGPAADFTEILYIFSIDSLEEAQKLMHNDPLYTQEIFYDDKWFEWHIHSPIWKTNVASIGNGDLLRDFGLLPKYPPEIKPQIVELKVEVTTPQRLFASFAKGTEEPVKGWLSGKEPPAFIVQHLFNRAGPGGMGPMGYDWESGPAVDRSCDLTILAVNSMQMAQLIRENDASVRYGANYDCRYFEWCIHIPFRKASPQHKETLKKFLRNVEVKLAEE